MSSTAHLVGPISRLLDRVVPDPDARDRAKLALIASQDAADPDRIRAELSAIVAEAQSTDRWASRARPTFLYVMYALLLWSIPMGVIAAAHPDWAAGITHGMSAYLNAIPEPLYALFGTGYLGYTVAREWGKGNR